MPRLTFYRNEIARALLAPLTAGAMSQLIRPTIATVYLTSYCNSRCTMCDFWKGERDPQELSTEQWGVVFSRLKAFGVDYVGVNASGEMFTRRDVFDILGHLSRLGMGFGVNSNGTLFSTGNARKLARLAPRAVTIGLDGVGDASYLATRGLETGFSKVSRHIDTLKREGIRNIGIGSILMESNLADWTALARFALDKGLSGVRYTAHHEAYFKGEAAGAPAAFADPQRIAAARAEIENLIALKRETGIVKNSETYLRMVPDFYAAPRSFFPVPCLQGSNRIEVDVYGNVTLCSFVTEPLGNLVKEEMEDIWNSERHRQARAAARDGSCPKCFLSCYAEENLRLSARGFLPTLKNSAARARQLLLP